MPSLPHPTVEPVISSSLSSFPGHIYNPTEDAGTTWKFLKEHPMPVTNYLLFSGVGSSVFSDAKKLYQRIESLIAEKLHSNNSTFQLNCTQEIGYLYPFAGNELPLCYNSLSITTPGSRLLITISLKNTQKEIFPTLIFQLYHPHGHYPKGILLSEINVSLRNANFEVFHAWFAQYFKPEPPAAQYTLLAFRQYPFTSISKVLLGPRTNEGQANVNSLSHLGSCPEITIQAHQGHVSSYRINAPHIPCNMNGCQSFSISSHRDTNRFRDHWNFFLSKLFLESSWMVVPGLNKQTELGPFDIVEIHFPNLPNSSEPRPLLTLPVHPSNPSPLWPHDEEPPERGPSRSPPLKHVNHQPGLKAKTKKAPKKVTSSSQSNPKTNLDLLCNVALGGEDPSYT